MANKFPTKCNVCGERILMVRSSGRWSPLDYPDRSLAGEWSNHMHLESKEWIWDNLDRGVGGDF